MKINYTIIVIVLLLLAIFILYPLSLGPYYWLAVNGYLPEWTSFVGYFYYPLAIIINNSEWCEKLLNWYLSFWVET